MKKLNITKKQYDESKYFNKKYGALKFVSESGIGSPKRNARLDTTLPDDC